MDDSSRDIEDQFRDAPFAGLKRETLEALSAAMVKVERGTEETLFHAGSDGDGCYYMRRGVMRVVIEDINGGESWPALIGRDEFVGEVSLIDRQPRSASVVAMTDCVLGYISRYRFSEIARADPQLYRAVAELVCKRLRYANRMICDERLGLEGRMAATFLRFAEAFGKPAGSGAVFIDFRVSQVRLAQLVAASRENVNRQIQQWRRQHLLDYDGQNYVIRQPLSFEAMSGSDLWALSV